MENKNNGGETLNSLTNQRKYVYEDNHIKTVEIGGRNFPVLDVNCSMGMDKKISDYCLKTLKQGNWCKGIQVRVALQANYERNDCMGVSVMTEPIEHLELYNGFQDYAWHNMPKNYQRYIDKYCGLFYHVCHNFIPANTIINWFNQNFSKALQINNDAWC